MNACRLAEEYAIHSCLLCKNNKQSTNFHAWSGYLASDLYVQKRVGAQEIPLYFLTASISRGTTSKASPTIP